jgi:hypothetical protein
MFLHFSSCCIVSWVRPNLLFECGAITVDRAGPLPLPLFVYDLANLPNAYQAYPTQVSIEYLILNHSYVCQRGKITSLYNTNWYLGSIISAWVQSAYSSD